MVPSMAVLLTRSQSKAYILFLNISFLLLFCVFFLIQFSSFDSGSVSKLTTPFNEIQEGCQGLQKLNDYKEKCAYLKSHNSCDTNGYINYIFIFYCKLGRFPLLGYTLLFLWLLVLFYLLGNTASAYFCSSLESLSKLLKLSPTIAGVTLLSLGNGTPDVFAILVSFMGNGSKNVGVNSVLGSGFFISCIIVGIISIINSRWTRIDKSDFVRDVCFLIFGLACILLMTLIGKVNIWGAMGFLSLYFVYVLVVYVMHVCWKIKVDVEHDSSYENGLNIPILPYSESSGGDIVELDQCFKVGRNYFGWFVYCLELPLSLPRRLTIPVVCEEKWSKPFAVASVTLAPSLLAFLCISEGFSSAARVIIFAVGGLMGIVLGTLAFFTTEQCSPPKKFLFTWLVGGFVMSVTWSYMTANELVALLVSIGHILGISSSILGLTVLAWGNSLGDLITNVAMAVKGGPEGTQVAISGCYAGPIFNIMVGLGLSLVLSSFKTYPLSFVIPKDPFLLETLAFLVLGLVWALVVLPWRNMKPDRVLGVGLLVIYLGSISLRFVQVQPLDSLTSSSVHLHH